MSRSEPFDLFSSVELDDRATPAKSGAPAKPPAPPRASAPERTSDPARSSAPPGLPLDSLRIAGARAGDEWTVSQLNEAARELLEGVFPPLWISGEVANFTRARSGHSYFTLRDAASQLRCVMWRDDARRLPTVPEEGMAVRALGRLTVYPARGEYQLTVTQLEAKGEGLWKLARERLRQKLDAEGLLAPHRKRPLPRFPASIGVVTSASGAVFHDIVKVVRKRAPWTRVVLAGCRVQGEGSAREVAAAIRLMAQRGNVDVLIVGRGGGSVEDLWAFNEEVVARAIADCRLPVISAVGHETDVTIADLVADHRAPTPSAAAEAAVPDQSDLIRNLQRDGWRLSRGIATQLGRAQEKVLYGRRRLAEAGQEVVTARRDILVGMARQLEALSPLAAFSRGYAIPLSRDGRIMRGGRDFVPGSPFDLRVRDAVVTCDPMEVRPDAVGPSLDSPA